MRSLFEISDVVLHDALPADQILGLLAYATIRLGPFRLDSLQVRRGRDGTFYVKWPARVDAGDYEHPYVEIADITIRKMIHDGVERAVLARARAEGRIP
jgi:hypothetical protein